jgi:hypothetical protein
MPALDLALDLFGGDLLGPDRIAWVAARMGILPPGRELPAIPEACLQAARDAPDTYLLFPGTGLMADGSPLTLKALRARLGCDPAAAEPCFYNQDWYLGEAFAGEASLRCQWYLLRKEVRPGSRGKDPDRDWDPQSGPGRLPSALLCAYAFFAYYLAQEERCLWEHDYVWCSDLDHLGDRIYVGRYRDPSGVNKNGFSVHRHLRIREGYGIVDWAN